MNSPTNKKIPIIPFGISIMRSFDDEFTKEEEIFKRQEKFLLLPTSIKTKLSSIDAGNKIKKIGQQFNLQPLQIASIARAIRNYYFGEVRLEDFPKIFVSEMRIDETTAQKIAQMAIQQIIRDDSYEKTYLSTLQTMPFNDALRKYPNFGEQLITSERIKIQGFPEPARPSIKNWIADYTSMFGYEKNNLLKRENYLFRSVNGQHLSQNDRERLSFVLKAFEENKAVSFNKDSGMLVFKEAEITVQPEKTKEGTLSFAYHQKMPFEKKSIPAENTFSPAPAKPAAPITPTPAQPINNTNPYLVKIPPKNPAVPKNVVNLKELM